MPDSHLLYEQQDSPHAASPDKTALLAAAICSAGNVEPQPSMHPLTPCPDV